MIYNGIEAPYSVFGGIGSAAGYGNEAICVSAAAIRGLSSAQPHIAIEELAGEGVFPPSPVVGGGS